MDVDNMSYEELLEVCRAREKFIDWILKHYPDAAKKYLGFEEIEKNEKC